MIQPFIRDLPVPASTARLPGVVLVLLAAVLGSRPALADQQLDAGLKEVVANAIAQAQCFPDRFDSAVWYWRSSTSRAASIAGQSLVPGPWA
jgi:hypothetical protein